MATPRSTPEELRPLRTLAAEWGQIVSRRALVAEGPGFRWTNPSFRPAAKYSAFNRAMVSNWALRSGCRPMVFFSRAFRRRYPWRRSNWPTVRPLTDVPNAFIRRAACSKANTATRRSPDGLEGWTQPWQLRGGRQGAEGFGQRASGIGASTLEWCTDYPDTEWPWENRLIVTPAD